MSKFQRKLAEMMGEETMVVSVKEWDKLEKERDELKKDRDGFKKSYKGLLEKWGTTIDANVELGNFNLDLQQELQALKDTIKEYFMIESDYWANMNKKNIAKFNKIESELNDLIK